MRVKRAAGLILLGLVLLIAGYALRTVQRRTAPEHVRQMVLRELQRAMEADVSIGSADLDLWGGVLRVRDVAVALKGDEEPFFQCKGVSATFDRLSLIGGSPVPEGMVLDQPTVRLVYSPEERVWNVSRLRLRNGDGPDEGASPRLLSEGLHVEDAALVVTDAALFGDDRARTYSGLRFDVARGLGEAGGWQLEGRALAGPARGLRLAGWLKPGPPACFGIDLSCNGLRAGPELWALVPWGDHVWSDYRVEGLVSFIGQITSTADGPLDYLVQVDVTQATVKTDYFPTRFSSATGRVVITPENVVLEDIKAVIAVEELDETAVNPSPAHVRLNGVVDTRGPGCTFEIAAADLPLCRTTVTGIPGAGREVWDRLRPTGTAQLSLTLADRDGGQAAQYKAALTLLNATLRPAELPVPLEHVAGVIVVENDAVHLRGLTGVLAPGGGQGAEAAGAPARFTAEGVWDPSGQRSRLAVAVRGVQTDEELVKSIPTVGPQIWEKLRPEVFLDAFVSLWSEPSTGAMDHLVLLELHGGRVAPWFCDMPVSQTTGAIRVDGAKLTIERMSASLDTRGPGGAEPRAVSGVDVRGQLDLQEDRVDLEVTARDMVLTERLLTAIPDVGPMLWDAAAPKGAVSLSGKISYDARAEVPLRYLLDVRMWDVSLCPEFVNIPLSALSGQLLVRQDRALSSWFTAVTCSGQLEGSAVAYYGGHGDMPSYGATLRFDQLDLAELVQAVTGQQRDLEGRLSGMLSLGGILGEAAATGGRGRVALTEGQLWKTPFFAKLLGVLRLVTPAGQDVPVKGEMAFTLAGDEATIGELELLGGGLSLTGAGTAWLDGRLDLKMVAVGAPEEGAGIPVFSSVIGWFLEAVEKELVWLDVTGSVDEPVFKHQVLSRITRPLTNLRGILLSPVFGSTTDEESPGE